MNSKIMRSNILNSFIADNHYINVLRVNKKISTFNAPKRYPM
jgi:hypothetical protein